MLLDHSPGLSPQKMWRFSDRAKLQRGYPADFELMFGHFGSNVTRIDAMYERPDDGRIVIFSGPQVGQSVSTRGYFMHRR